MILYSKKVTPKYKVYTKQELYIQDFTLKINCRCYTEASYYCTIVILHIINEIKNIKEDAAHLI